MEIKATNTFLKCAKPLAKKYRSFKKDYENFLDDLEKNPNLGTDLGAGLRKVRMAIESKGKGKSGGARVITFNTFKKNGILYLVFIYDKSDYDSVDTEIIKEIIREEGL